MEVPIKISVIIRCRNEENHIGLSIQSVVDHLKNPEIIIIDNESTDESMKVVSLFDKYNIKKYSLNGNYTPGKALNFGVGKAKNILVIDDSEDIHYLLEVFFEDGPESTNAVYCKSLKDGLKLIRENHQFWDVVFTDLNIGHEKGEDLLFTIGRENLRGKMKIIAMSAMIDEAKRMELINIGFNDAVSKNFDQAIINALIKY